MTGAAQKRTVTVEGDTMWHAPIRLDTPSRFRGAGPHRHESGTALDGGTAEGGQTRSRESGLPRTEATQAFGTGFGGSRGSRSPPWGTGNRRAAPRHADGRALRAAAVHYGVSIRGLRVQDDRGKSPLHSHTGLSIGLGGGGASSIDPPCDHRSCRNRNRPSPGSRPGGRQSRRGKGMGGRRPGRGVEKPLRDMRQDQRRVLFWRGGRYLQSGWNSKSRGVIAGGGGRIQGGGGGLRESWRHR